MADRGRDERPASRCSPADQVGAVHGQVTRAQELIASAQIVRARRRTRGAEPYNREITHAVEALVSRSGQIDHPLTRAPERRTRAAVLILTSDRGFAGGFNANVLREAAGLRRLLAEHRVESVPFVSGRKGITWHRFRESAWGRGERLLRHSAVRERAGDHRGAAGGL